MNIQTIKINEINPAPYNPRIDLKPGDSEFEKLKNSIDSFGYVEPLVWNSQTGTLVSGHQRFKVLKEQKLTEVEVSVVDLPLEKEKALNLALNKIRGDWDDNKLADLLSELSEMPDLDVGLTGFDLPEISEILDDQIDSEDDYFDIEEEVKKITEPVTKKGDVIELGPHKIMCGDASSTDDLKALMQNQKAALLHTDPPYNVNYYGGNRPTPDARPKNSRQWEKIYSDNLSQEEYEDWLRNIFSNMVSHISEQFCFYIWNGHKQFGPMHQLLSGLAFHVSCVITWAKPNFAIGFGDYNQQTEFCLYGWKEKNGRHFWNGPTNETTLWDINRDPTQSYIHPTQKPVAIPHRAIRNSSKRNDIVLDLFLGSGSTLIASERLDRRCFGLEIDPRYVDAIIRRYIAFVGKDKVSAEIIKKYSEANHE